ncbi:MAG TPA: polysaccharide deacetylase family protein, partial [Gaiellales bacterium]|nr:polysaccharide deacetylase family protein [Gaiellales bacterium]
MARIGRIGSRVGLVVVVLVAAGWRAPRVVDQPAPLELRVDGTVRQAVAGSTLADATRDLGLTPRPGDLVDVAGVTIAAGRYPGHVLVDGAPLPGGQPLRSGDSLRLVPGPDRTEPVTTQRVPVPGGEPADPEYTLGRVPGDEVTVRGKISGKVASSAFRATGPASVPQAVALTFDDGPWPGQTMQVLAVLRRFRARATFFTVGNLAEHFPRIIQAEQRQRGVLVEDHSWSHPLTPPFGEQRPGVVREQIGRARSTLIAEGVTPTLFRPPGGGWSDQVVAIASSMGCRVVLWSVDPRDWAPGRTAKGIARSVLSHVEAGSIVIMHDGGGDRTATIRALPRIIRG